ncbi:unnamed protein product [Polarella glacialis]|uniref:Uncharacterized protein n=1 Tax=Polarella glacialis TaxID=89957 RepID=A0A813LY59_POLGL|nr:unnamed protein product [Polarella glacialis]|mmetsp:Transcript_59886/g.107770  ORF Transcript_59886/g.107770 Transcript_59886/m.107770 type:complete len:218 (-) Transcript_59886:65-718(-)
MMSHLRVPLVCAVALCASALQAAGSASPERAWAASLMQVMARAVPAASNNVTAANSTAVPGEAAKAPAKAPSAAAEAAKAPSAVAAASPGNLTAPADKQAPSAVAASPENLTVPEDKQDLESASATSAVAAGVEEVAEALEGEWQAESTDSYVSSNEHQSSRSTTLLWTMAITYSALTVLAVVIFLICADRQPSSHHWGSEKASMLQGATAGRRYDQ